MTNRSEWRDWLGIFLGIFAALTGIAYVLWRSLIAPMPEIDFRFFWVAGKAWQAGINPYGPGFADLGSKLLPDGNATLYWFYPPQWWAICRLLAELSFPDALAVWRLTSGLLIYAGATMLVWTLSTKPARARIGPAGLACAAAVLIEPTANLLAYGQSSALMFLSICLIVVGLLDRRSWMITLGLTLTLLKPQVGLLLVIVLLILPRARLAILAALAISLVFALPHFASFNVLQTARQFLANVGAYGHAEANSVIMFTGPLHLLARLIPIMIDAKVQMLLALPPMIGAILWLRNNPADPRPAVFLLISAMTAFVPIHAYDATILLIPLIFAIFLRLSPAWVIIAAMLLVRPARLDLALGVPFYGAGLSGGLIWLTLSAMILFGLAVMAAIRQRPVVQTDLRRGQFAAEQHRSDDA